MDTIDQCFLIKSFQVNLGAFSFLLGDGKKFNGAFVFRHASTEANNYLMAWINKANYRAWF